MCGECGMTCVERSLLINSYEKSLRSLSLSLSLTHTHPHTHTHTHTHRHTALRMNTDSTPIFLPLCLPPHYVSSLLHLSPHLLHLSPHLLPLSPHLLDRKSV